VREVMHGNMKIKVLIPGDEHCDDDDDNDDPMVGAKKAKLKKLEAMLKDKENQYRAEVNWMNQADALVVSLRKKTGNVRLHLKDLHKAMVQLHFAAKKIRAQLEGLEEKNMMGHKLKQMEEELRELMTHSESVRAEVQQLNSRKQEYMQRIEEIRQAVAALKAKNHAQEGAHHGSGSGGAEDMSFPIDNGNCPCSGYPRAPSQPALKSCSCPGLVGSERNRGNSYHGSY